MWWWEKNHPLAIYMDQREVPSGTIEIRPNWNVSPDVIGDFRNMAQSRAPTGADRKVSLRNGRIDRTRGCH